MLQNSSTASAIEEKLQKLVVGHDLGDITQELCDFSLEEQNAAAEAQGIQPTTASDFIPVLGKSVKYIVACVFINEHDEVLMMQEAKQSCRGNYRMNTKRIRLHSNQWNQSEWNSIDKVAHAFYMAKRLLSPIGKWYLPAGRMKMGETISEAAVREVFEETGLNAEITTLLAVEAAGGSWFRFVLTGQITGGTLKTPAQADKESLQGKWVAEVKKLPLRAYDIFQIIDIAKTYKYRKSPRPTIWHCEILPTRYSHHKNYLRVIAVIRKRATNSMNILVSEKNIHHFPTVEIHAHRSLHSTLRKFIIKLLGAELPQHRTHGILSVEHCPSPAPHATDGICLNVLVVFIPPLEEVALIGKCAWHELSKQLEEKIEKMLCSTYSAIPLNIIR